MSEHSIGRAARMPLFKVAIVLMLAAAAAGCDRCGDFVSPIRFQADPQTEACRGDAPTQR